MPHEYLNPPGLFHHPNYTRMLTVEKPSKLRLTSSCVERLAVKTALKRPNALQWLSAFL